MKNNLQSKKAKCMRKIMKFEAKGLSKYLEIERQERERGFHI